MENIRKHRNIGLVTTEEKYLRMVMKPNFKSGVLFGESLMGCEMGKAVMNKPVYLGQVILDLSKIVMYEFHYDYMVPKYGDRLKLCYMDTDSLVDHIKTEDFYAVIADDVQTRFNASNYIPDRPLPVGLNKRSLVPKYGDRLKLCYMDTDSLVYHIKTEDFYADIADDVQTRFNASIYIPDRPLPVGLNKKVIGLMKDELGGAIMTEFMALRPKLYSYKKLDGPEDKKCNGINKCIVKKTLTFEDYKTCLFSDSTEYRSQLMFRSAKHEVHTIEVNTVALNRDDDERISRKDGISTFARGHKDLSWSPLLGVLSLI